MEKIMFETPSMEFIPLDMDVILTSSYGVMSLGIEETDNDFESD